MPGPKKEKECSIWGSYIAGDPVFWMKTKELGDRYRVAKANHKKVPRGHVPIRPEDTNSQCDTLPFYVPMDDIERI